MCSFPSRLGLTTKAAKTPAGEAVKVAAKPDAERAVAAKLQTAAERLGLDTIKMTAEDAFAYAAAESRMAFVYGMISGPIIFCFGGVVFLLLGRRRTADPA